MNNAKQIAKYIALDVIAAWLSWAVFYSFRKIYWESIPTDALWSIESHDPNFLMGLFFIPIFWVVLYFLLGDY